VDCVSALLAKRAEQQTESCLLKEFPVLHEP
jgi:hypothetical protein